MKKLFFLLIFLSLLRNSYNNDVITSMIANLPYDKNIILGTPVEITDGDENAGLISFDDELIIIDYKFKVNGTMTSTALPEYITVRSQLGTIFELGEEYCISPNHINNTLWDNHVIYSFKQFIKTSELSENDISAFKKEIGKQPRPDAETVAEAANLTPEFLSKADVAAEITITDKEADSGANNIFDVSYDLKKIVKGSRHKDKLKEYNRLNSDVTVGETYLILLSVTDNSFLMPAARTGAVIPVKSAEYTDYINALAKTP